ncbi:MAG: tetratricopeptide repeat protein [Desulforhopalus sp.]
MNRIILFILLTTLLAGTWVFHDLALAATSKEQLFQQGNEAYSRGDYTAAIDDYEQITRLSGYSPGVLFNLANSYAQLGKTGLAVLNYERAHRLAPSDADITGNLELVKKENGLFPKERSKTERFFHLLNLKQWSTVFLCILVLLTLWVLSTMKLRFSRQLTISVSAGSLLLAMLAVAGAFFHHQYFNPAVVIVPDARLYISPFENAGSNGTIQEGRLVYPVKKHGAYTYVTDETNRRGWIPSESIEAVCKSPG